MKSDFEQLAMRSGVSTHYVDAFGDTQSVNPRVIETVLKALGEPTPRDAWSVTPQRAYQGPPGGPWRMWILAVQLYAVRSSRNWGHGDFTDLSNLIDIAARHGAAGVGLNPLHALFDDRPEDASPYSPSSRSFLNPLYIDIEALPECRARPTDEVLGALRAPDKVDYAAVAALKQTAMREAFAAFRKNAAEPRVLDFEQFRARRGDALVRFAAFQALRRTLGNDWRQWPEQFRKPRPELLDEVRRSHSSEMEFVAYQQWLAEGQLSACAEKARDAGLPVGLYLDVAVGVSPEGADAWGDQDEMLVGLSMGAPPDILNRSGQNWGLATYNPVSLRKASFEPFRRMLSAVMRYAGAIRLDHVLGLNRVYVVPPGMPAKDGTYIQFPLEELLEVVVQESHRYGTIVIGEDLGTVPDALREKLKEWGLWSYRLMLFERTPTGEFIAASQYPEEALVCFSTHDLPTFEGWRSGHDLKVKNALGIDPGETSEDRRRAYANLSAALSTKQQLDLLSVIDFLSRTPSRLLSIALEDIAESRDQVNLPGTVSEHPNWRWKPVLELETLSTNDKLAEISRLAALAGR